MVILSDFLTPFPRQHILRNFLPFPPLNFRPLLWTAPDIEKYKKTGIKIDGHFFKENCESNSITMPYLFFLFLNSISFFLNFYISPGISHFLWHVLND